MTQSGYTIGSPYYTTEVGAFENSDSPYGTFDQGGNVNEWNEEVDGSSRVLRGGAWNDVSGSLQGARSSTVTPTYEFYDLGFRVASVPEPASISLMLCGAIAGLLWWNRKRKS